MMKQYREARQSLEADTLLLFRLGDFYEMFEEDAEQGAALLGITLTKRHDMPCLLYTSPSPRDATLSRMPSSA